MVSAKMRWAFFLNFVSMEKKRRFTSRTVCLSPTVIHWPEEETLPHLNI